MCAFRDVRRDVRHLRDDGRAALRPVTVGEVQVVRAADLAARDFLAVNQHDERGRVSMPRGYRPASILSPSRKLKRYSPSRREDVREVHAAASPERIAVFMGDLSRGTRAGLTAAAAAAAIENLRHFRNRLADRPLRDLAGGRQVLFHEGR